MSKEEQLDRELSKILDKYDDRCNNKQNKDECIQKWINNSLTLDMCKFVCENKDEIDKSKCIRNCNFFKDGTFIRCEGNTECFVKLPIDGSADDDNRLPVDDGTYMCLSTDKITRRAPLCYPNYVYRSAYSKVPTITFF